MTDSSFGLHLTDSGAASADRSASSLAHGRTVLSAATQVLRELPGVLWQSSGGELGELMRQVDEVAALAAGVRVAVTAEALQRGEIADSQCAGTRGWVAQHAPSLSMGAGQVAKVVEQTGSPALAPVREAVIAGRLPVPVALVVLSEFDKLRRRIVPEAETLVLDGLIRIGVEDGSREVRRLRPALLAKYGVADELQRDQDRAARLVSLSHAVCTDEGVWEYRFVADVEARAVLEAAIGPLSAPWHPDGQRDERSAQQRRGQALVEVCRRVTAAAKAAGAFGGHRQDGSQHAAECGSDRPGPAGDTQMDPPADHEGAVDEHDDRTPGRAVGEPAPIGDSPTDGGSVDQSALDPVSVPDEDSEADPDAEAAMIHAALAGLSAGGAKATLMLTMSLADLQERIGAATTLGTLAAGSLLAPETARRIACDARVIPMLLGGAGEVLDLGRAERLFTPAQARVVLLRDRQCTFPGCDIPGFWGQLHHVWHWLDGGGTDIANAALLCTRHHTIVHRDQLTATVTPTGVEWDTVPGSYERMLARNRTPAA